MKVVSWNLEGRLSDLATNQRGTPEKIVAAIREFDADVLVHPEAFGEAAASAAENELRELGYTLTAVAYDDLIARGDRAAVPNPHLMILSRLPIITTEVIRPGNLRNMLALQLDAGGGKRLRVIGVHLEDREEAMRLKQVEPLIEYIHSSDLPTVMMGDFNAMPPHTFKSNVIHSGLFRDLAGLVPHTHMRYTIQRLSDMGSGTTIQALLTRTKLRNTDPALQPTTTPKMRRMEWMPSLRFAKIDWILATPDIAFKDFGVSPDLGSDHRALSLTITLD